MEAGALCTCVFMAVCFAQVLLEALCLEIAGAGPDSSRMASMLDLNAPSFTALAAGSVSGLPPAMEALKADSFTGPNRSSFSGFAATGPGANLRRNLVGSGSMSMIAGRGGSVRAVGAAEAAVAALSPHPPLGEVSCLCVLIHVHTCVFVFVCVFVCVCVCVCVFVCV